MNKVVVNLVPKYVSQEMHITEVLSGDSRLGEIERVKVHSKRRIRTEFYIRESESSLLLFNSFDAALDHLVTG